MENNFVVLNVNDFGTSSDSGFFDIQRSSDSKEEVLYFIQAPTEEHDVVLPEFEIVKHHE
jgi:hypothetical protein